MKPASAFCHSATRSVCIVYSLLGVLFGVVCETHKPKAYNVEEISETVQGREQHVVQACVRGLLERLSLMTEESSPAFRAVLVLASALVGFVVGSVGGNGDGRVPIAFLTHQIRRPHTGIGSPLGSHFPPGRRLSASSSSSEEGEYESTEAPPPQSPWHEELLEVMTRALAK